MVLEILFLDYHNIQYHYPQISLKNVLIEVPKIQLWSSLIPRLSPFSLFYTHDF